MCASLNAPGAPMGVGVAAPETRSSPCRPSRNSPYSARSPVFGLRVKATPEPERASKLPNTIAWIVTEVPSASEIAWCARYALARRLSHDSNTAPTARSSCQCGPARTSPPPCSAMVCRIACSSRSNGSGVVCARAASICGAGAAMSASASSPSTISLNMRQKRNQVSSANLCTFTACCSASRADRQAQNAVGRRPQATRCRTIVTGTGESCSTACDTEPSKAWRSAPMPRAPMITASQL